MKKVASMFEEFYRTYGPKEQEVVTLIKRCIGGGYHSKGDFWRVTVVTLGMVFCDTGKASPKEERLEWPVTNEGRDGERGWGRFCNGQICRLKTRRIKEKWVQNLVARPWYISEVARAREDCPELQAIPDEYHKPVMTQDEVLGELTPDKDYDVFEGEIQWCGKDVRLSPEVNAESKPSWTCARNAAKRLVTDQEIWDKAMRDFTAKNLTGLANNWPSQDEENTRDLETASTAEEEFAQRILLTGVFVSPGGRFTAYYSDNDMFWGHTVEVNGSLKKGITYANLAG